MNQKKNKTTNQRKAKQQSTHGKEIIKKGREPSKKNSKTVIRKTTTQKRANVIKQTTKL